MLSMCVALAMNLTPLDVPVRVVDLSEIDCPSLSKSVIAEARLCRGAIGILYRGEAVVRKGKWQRYAIAHEMVHAHQMREGVNPMTDEAEKEAIRIGLTCSEM